MFPGPVFNLELRRLSRRKRYYALLTLYGLLLLYVAWSNNPQTMFDLPAGPQGGLSVDQWHYAGKSLFQDLANWQMALVVLLTPAMVAGVIAEERERKTMPGLLVSRLTSGEIVLGKLGARLLPLACFVALGMPVVVLVERFGGVGLTGVLVYYAATATTAFFLGAVSILISTQARRPRDAVVCAYALLFAWHVGPAVALLMLSGSSGLFALLRFAAQAVAATCPLFVMLDHARGTRFWESPNHSVWMIALQAILGTLAARAAVRRLRPAFLKDESRPQDARARGRDEAAPETIKPPPGPAWLRPPCDDDAPAEIELAPPGPPGMEPPARSRRRPSCGDDAMIWKEVWATPLSPTTRVLAGLALATLTLAALSCLQHGLASVEELREHGYNAEFSDSYHRLALNVRLRYLVTITAGLALLWVSSVAACSLAGERDKGTWTSLLATPLSGREIIRGKVIGAFWGVRGLLVIWVALVTMGLIFGAVHPLGVLAVALATATYLAFGCALGMTCSLRARTSSRAVVSTLVTLILLNGAYLLVVLPFKLQSTLPFAGLTPFVEESALMSYLDAKWLIDFESPDERLLDIALACALSVVLYAGATFVLALWTLRSFDRVVDRPGTTTAVARRPPG